MTRKNTTLSILVALAAGISQADVVREAWVARHDGAVGGKDEVQGLVVDAAGNAYVAGSSDSGGGDYDYATVKYLGNGTQAWVARYDGGFQGADWVKALAVDAAGNVYVTGSSASEDGGFDFATVKYDAAGNPLWIRRYDGPARGDDRVNALALDASGNLYLTGSSAGDGGSAQSVTLKYGTDGELLWATRSGSLRASQSLTALAVDADGNVYAAGRVTRRNRDSDYLAIKYDPAGNPLWTAVRDWSAHDEAHYLAVDAAGNLYLTGEVVRAFDGLETIAHQDTMTAKYSSDGQELWSTSFDGGEGRNDLAAALRLDPEGNIYVGGTSLPLAADDGDLPAAEFFTTQYDPDGNPLWTARYKELSGVGGAAQSLTLDRAGNAYVLGFGRATDHRKPELILVKYDRQGRELWVARHEGLGTAGATGLVADDAGSLWVAGSTGDGRDYLTTRYVQDANNLLPGTSAATEGVP